MGASDCDVEPATTNNHHSEKSRRSTPALWPREHGTICPFGICPCFLFLWQGQLWSCWVVPFWQAFRLSCGFGTQFHHLSFSTPKIALSTVQKTYILKGKSPILTRKMQSYWKSKRAKGSIFTHAHARPPQNPSETPKQKSYCASYRVWPFDPTALAITQTIASRSGGMGN